jgi:ketosteroid isomerase-like protein
MDHDPILAGETALREAMLSNDVEALDRLIDDDLMFTAIDGSVVGKQDDLAAHRARLLRATRLEPSERRIQTFGDTAVVSVRVDLEGTYGGAPASGAYRYTRIWRRKPDGWRIVAGHMSVIQPASRPAS